MWKKLPQVDEFCNYLLTEEATILRNYFEKESTLEIT